MSETQIHYELLQIGDNILFPVESAGLNKLRGFASIVQVSGRCRDEIAEVGKILAGPSAPVPGRSSCSGAPRSRPVSGPVAGD